MPNHEQPQGVIKTLDLTKTPDTGFFSNEFYEPNGEITLPNLLILNGNATATLVLNDGLLRTHCDGMSLKATGDVDLTLIIAKQPITDLAVASQNETDYFAKKYHVTTNAPTVFYLRLVNGDYILTKEVTV